MTYAEMQAAEVKYLKAIAPKATKQRGATKAQLGYRAKFAKRCPCVVFLGADAKPSTVPCSLPLTHNSPCQPEAC